MIIQNNIRIWTQFKDQSQISIQLPTLISCNYFITQSVTYDTQGIGCPIPFILNPGTRWKKVFSFTSQLLYPLCPWKRRMGGSQSQSGCFVKKKSPYSPLYQLLPQHACDFYVGYHCQNISGQGKM